MFDITDCIVNLTPMPRRCTPADVPAIFHVHDWEPEFRAHLTHYDAEYNAQPAEDCAFCAGQMLLPELRDAWVNGTEAERDLLWSMQDGYGVPGFVPGQGQDWSGIRDSFPATLYAMHRELKKLRGK